MPPGATRADQTVGYPTSPGLAVTTVACVVPFRWPVLRVVGTTVLPVVCRLGTTRGPDPHASPWAGTRPGPASQASRAVSAMRTLRPRCTTGSWPVQRRRAKVSGLTPNHRCASARGISCGGAGRSKGSSCCRADGWGQGRGRLDGEAMIRVSPRRSGMCDAGNRGALPSRGAWADTGARDRTRDAHLFSISRRRCRPEPSPQNCILGCVRQWTRLFSVRLA